MHLVKTKELNKYEDKKVQVNGWVYNSRRSGKIAFLILRDGFGMIQAIIEKSHIGEKNFEEFKKINQESSITIIGKVVKNERALGGFEIFENEFL